MKKNIETKLEKLTPNIVIIFLYIQPFLDILAAFLIKNNISNFITSGIRILFMLYMLIYITITNYKEKKKTITYLSLLVLCIIVHTFGMFHYKGPDILITEIKTTISTYYSIFLLISFSVLYRENTLKKIHLRNIFYMYLILTFIPNILGIGFDSYWHSKLGSAGWFYSANVLGSILIILLPMVISEIKKLKPIYIIVTIIMIIYVIFSIGTKTPVLGLILLIGLNLILFIYKMIKQKEKKKIIITSITLFIMLITGIIIIPKTSFYKNLEIHLNYIIKEQNYKITSIEFLDNFIFSERLSMEKDARKIYTKSPLLEKIFGIGYVENYNTSKEREKIIEIDYFDILYREGIVGFILYFIPIIYIIIKTLKNIKITQENINIIGVSSLIVFLAFFQGHIFITPAISIFVALILVINSMNKEENEV